MAESAFDERLVGCTSACGASAAKANEQNQQAIAARARARNRLLHQLAAARAR